MPRASRVRVPSWRRRSRPRRAGVWFLCFLPRGRRPGVIQGGVGGRPLVASACAALWSVRLSSPSLLLGHPRSRYRWPALACAAGVGVGATLLSAAQSLMLRPSPLLLQCSVRRRALAGALGTCQCGVAASGRVVGSVVGVVAAAQRAVEAQVGVEGLGDQLRSSIPTARHRSPGWRQRLSRQLCVASCVENTQPPLVAAPTDRP